ncbi:MAG: hypothetical protein HQ474_01670 [Flammeovirgaceae bacterium]|nr:hypothetical protein [Flammeovirgaceae bacterium]
MIKVFGCHYTNDNGYEGYAVIVLEDDGSVAGTDMLGGIISGTTILDGEMLCVHATVVVAEGYISVPNPDYGEMDGVESSPVYAEIPKDLEVGGSHISDLSGGKSTKLKVIRVY